MDLNRIKVGKDVPNRVNVVIEIPANSGPIKYEFDKEAGAIVVDRIMPTSMSYPCNYGFVPHTLSGDGDPVDVLVYTNHPLVPGCVISVRPIGVLVTRDESGEDEKVLAVPDSKTDLFFENVKGLGDVPNILLERIKHFFENYKKLEKGKWVEVVEWRDDAAACEIIMSGITRYDQGKK